jgi:hypothetical protein
MSKAHSRVLCVLCLAIFFPCREADAAIVDSADINPLIGWNNQVVAEILALTAEMHRLTQDVIDTKEELRRDELYDIFCFSYLSRRLDILRDPVEKAVILGLLSRGMSSSEDESVLLGPIATQISRFTKAQADKPFMNTASIQVCASANGQNHYRAAMHLVEKLIDAAAPLAAKICNREGLRC